MKVLCFALFARAFNLLLGYGGLLSFGHAAYFGMASYISAHAAKVWGFSPELAILPGTADRCGARPRLRRARHPRQGIYFAMITLALSQMVYFFCCRPLHRRRGRHPGRAARQALRVPGPRRDINLYYVVAAIFLFGLLAIYRSSTRPSGRS